MKLRPAGAADASSICTIWNAVIRTSTITFTTDEKQPDQIIAMIAQRAPAFIVAERHKTVIGFATYGGFRQGPGYRDVVEHSVYLDPAAQRAGAGQALMHALFQVARDQGKRVMVACITGDNASARQFHAKLGFEEVGFMSDVGRKFGKLHDLRWMQKNL